MPRYKSVVEYDGTGFCGWQRQKDSLSIQQVLEDAIFSLSKEKTTVFASGRTDAGVHARGQVVHFDLSLDIPANKIMAAVNHFSRPSTIALLSIEEVDVTFHARFSAKQKYYEYKIVNRRAPLTIDDNKAYHEPIHLNVEEMNKAAKYLLGEHDFTSFRDSECQAQSPVKTVDAVYVEQNGENISIHAQAKSFLHHMVRNIAGTLCLVGKGKIAASDMNDILSSLDRSKAGPTAPACGLYLNKVVY